MATKYRTRSEANIYHVTIRGVARQIIFEDDDDRRAFGMRMRRFLEEEGVELYAWCLMVNHVHMLVHANIETLARFMQRLQISYAAYFNKRHGRTGHLFQDRFDSVATETDEQLMATVRYIHRNPLKIPGQSAQTYEWSSYREYLHTPFISKTDFVKSLFNSREEFIAFHESWDAPNAGRPLSPAEKQLDDDEAIEYACSLLDLGSITSIAAMEKPQRDSCLAQLKERGMTVNQIARITGVGRNIVQRARKQTAE